MSPGCQHCFAQTFAERFRGVPWSPFEQGSDLRLVPEKITLPLEFAKPRRIFVNSMSDLFHEGVPDDYIERVARVMAASGLRPSDGESVFGDGFPLHELAPILLFRWPRVCTRLHLKSKLSIQANWGMYAIGFQTPELGGDLVVLTNHQSRKCRNDPD